MAEIIYGANRSVPHVRQPRPVPESPSQTEAAPSEACVELTNAGSPQEKPRKRKRLRNALKEINTDQESK